MNSINSEQVNTAPTSLVEIINLPYFNNRQHAISLLKEAPGLVWYHQGLGHSDQEWISAWPTEEYCYLGQHQIMIQSHLGKTTRIEADFQSFLLAQIKPVVAVANLRFVGGLVGHISYDFGLELHHITSKFPTSTTPVAVVGQYDWVIHIDHKRQQTLLIIQPMCPHEIRSHLNSVQQAWPNTNLNQNNTVSNTEAWNCSMSKAAYTHAFQKLKDYLRKGDSYQVNLTRQWTFNDPMLSDISAYLALTNALPAPFSVFHRHSKHSLLSVSPERFISVHKGIATTQPIKGTRARSSNPLHDHQLKQELLNSLKDQAENLMIVDLLRNDLAKNAIPGTVKVNKLFELQSFVNVHHLVSTIEAQVKPNISPLTVLFDAFPGGSITGAPKKRAMEIIDELEQCRRGFYCGSSFYLSANGELDSNILIRTLTYSQGQFTCSGGGGIILDSQLEHEFEESDMKVKRLREAIHPSQP